MSRSDARTAQRGPARTKRWFGPATALLAWIGVALMPKCPLCVAVALSALGVGAAWATGLSPYVRTGAWSVAGMALLVTLYVEGRRLRARHGDRRPNRVCSCG